MEEESVENKLLPSKGEEEEGEVVVDDEQKGENATNEETLLEPNNTSSVEEEKRPSPKTRFFKLFERKKISSSESNTECPLKDTAPTEPKRSLPLPSFSGFFNKFRRGKCKRYT